MANKRKSTTTIVAGVTAAALLLGGTFAWTSIQQEAKNEAIVDINPGGRLHDDFNGANKDVYVENFGDDQTGVPIFARIRLDQYMEIGQEAGKNKETDMANRNVKPLIGTDIDDVSTWITYIPGDLSDTTKVQANDNWTWTMGNDTDNKPYYMPTFNKNKDSLAADINGTYEGTKEDDIVHYDDYIFYDANSEAVKKDATYDWDEDTDEDYATSTRDENSPIDSADVLLKEETHKATQITKTAQVILMEDWDGTAGDYWVYDTDGWAYWANAIMPGETTGLLLDGITLSKTPDDNYYYGINVVGQFATAGDLSAFNSGNETMTKEAEALLVTLTGSESLVINGADTINIGEPATFTATRLALGGGAVSQPTFTWAATATDADGNAIEGISIADGVLTTESTVPHGTKITVTATASDATATLAEGDETTTDTSSVSKTVTALGNIKIRATGGLKQYKYYQTTNETFTVAQIYGADAADGTITWSVTDGKGNALTETSITSDGNLTIGSAELATNIIVTATYKSNDGTAEFSGTYKIQRYDEITTYTNYSTDTQAVALMTRNGSTLDSGDPAYTLTFVRVKDDFTFAGYAYDEAAYTYTYAEDSEGDSRPFTYGGAAIEYAFTDIEINMSYNEMRTHVSSWRTDSFASMITSLDFDGSIKPGAYDAVRWFKDLSNLETADVSRLDISQVTFFDSLFENDSKLHTIIGLDKLNLTNVSSVTSMFKGCASLTELDLSRWDFGENIGNFDYMFYNCTNLTTLDLSWGAQMDDGRFGQNLNYMFYGCKSLTTIKGIDDWNVSNAKYFKSMFRDCTSLTELDLSGWKILNYGASTPQSVDMSYMFSGCSSLETIGSFSPQSPDLTNVENMFYDCAKLKLDCTGWVVTNVTSYTDFNLNAPGVTAPNWPS